MFIFIECSSLKDIEKLDKYRDLTRKLIMLWLSKFKLVPVTDGVLGTIPILLQKSLKELGILYIK